MLKKLNKALFSLITLLVIYNFFFWKEKLGMNIFIYTILLVISLIWINPKSIKSPKVIIMLLTVIYCAVMVIINNSVISKFTLITGIMVFTGFLHQPEIKSLFAAFITYVSSNFMIPVTIAEGITKSKEKSAVIRIIYKTIKLGIIPLIIFLIFYAIYALSNNEFRIAAANVIKDVGDFLYRLFKDYPFMRFMFLFLGFILLAGVLYNKNLETFTKYDLLFKDKLSRDKNKKLVWLNKDKKYIPFVKQYNIIYPRFYSLLNEHKVGVILLVLVNLLILGLNIVDIKTLWLKFNPSEIKVFSDYVYAGTYMLIFSIILSMIILLYFFRGNLNFYKKNKTLKFLSYLWILQNAFMALSVGLRNYYYIIYTHTISYRKIGVIVYLLLTLTGLATMTLKISQLRTTYNIIKINSWAVFIMFLIISSFNWDKNIVEYNLANPKTEDIDVAYLLELSDDVLPLLDQNKELMKKDFYIPRSYRIRTTFALDYFNKRKEKFSTEQNGYCWLSWNLADYNVNKYFNEKK